MILIMTGPTLPGVRTGYVEMISRLPSRSSQRLLQDIIALAQDPREPVLIIGPRGAGKTVVANAIHELSPRSLRPFVKFDLALLTDELATSDLFGHVRGAFTGAVGSRQGAFKQAHGGTLFLDELLHASRGIQQRLLNAIEYREVRHVGSDQLDHADARVIAATNVQGDEIEKDERFLPDLFDRLRSFIIAIAPLRERRADLPLLICDAAEIASRAVFSRPAPKIHDAVMELLLNHEWPDNVRGVYTSVRRMVLQSRGADCITLEHCHPTLDLAKKLMRSHKPRQQPEQAIITAKGHAETAAGLAGVSVPTIYRHIGRLRELGRLEGLVLPRQAD